MPRRLPPFPPLVAFDAVVRHGSFTRAAAELGITQSAVSHQLRRLEHGATFALQGFVAFDEFGQDFPREQLERLHDVLVAVATGRTRQDHLVDAAVFVAA